MANIFVAQKTAGPGRSSGRPREIQGPGAHLGQAEIVAGEHHRMRTGRSLVRGGALHQPGQSELTDAEAEKPVVNLPRKCAATSSATTSRTRRSSPTPSSTPCCASCRPSRTTYPELRTPDSPTPAGRRRRLRHRLRRRPTIWNGCCQPGQRLRHPTSCRRGRRGVACRGRHRRDYLCELKIDGVALALVYRDGVLVRGATPR